MGNKYVDDFEFPADFGFTGSTKPAPDHGVTHPSYAHGGAHNPPKKSGHTTVIAIMAPPAMAGGMPHETPKAPRTPQQPKGGKISVTPQKAAGALKAAAGLGALAGARAASRGAAPAAAAAPVPGLKKGGKVPRNKMIQHAIKRPGALTQKANAAGMTINEFAERHEHDPGVTGHEARFYEHVLKPAAAAKRHRR